MIYSAYITFRDRGLIVLVKAIIWLFIANFMKFVLSKKYLQKKIYDYRMFIDLNDPGISRTLLLFGEREIDHKLMLEKILKPGMVVFDIGANIGYYPLMELGLIGSEGSLLAIEPSPSNINLLKKNLKLNGHGNIEVVAGAVSNKNGTAKFYLSEFSNLNTFHPTGSGESFVSGKAIDVETFTVPKLVDKYGPPDLIRMDVEGHEVEVINGMLDAIQSGLIRPMVIFETHLSRYSDTHDMRKTLTSLFELGYEVTMASSSWEKGTGIIEKDGYVGGDEFKTDGLKRKIFTNIKTNDAIKYITKTGGLRTVLLSSSKV